MTTEKIKKQLDKYKYPLLALLLGLVIMLIPSGKVSADKTDNTAADDEIRLETVLQKCEGVGEAKVLLSENGAVIVCEGAENPEVRLSIIKAVEAFTGFTSDRIQVLKTALNMGG
ncbi:MAG: hypothetical protein J6K00_05175 [Oscillospiraceae bacterium]|nr:hypothetical protein [Oscillospiraceae bacterium]